MADLKNSFFNLSETLINALRVYRDRGAVIAQESKQETRINICISCTELIDGKCNKCGCYMNIKVRLEAAKCPIGKW